MSGEKVKLGAPTKLGAAGRKQTASELTQDVNAALASSTANEQECLAAKKEYQSGMSTVDGHIVQESGAALAAHAEIAGNTASSGAAGIRKMASSAHLKKNPEDLRKEGKKAELALKEKGAYDVYEHMWSHEDVATLYDTSLSEGLSKASYDQKFEDYGFNEMTPAYTEPEWLKFLKHQVGGFSTLLWFGSILCFAVYSMDGSMDNLYLGIVLGAVVFGTGIFAYVQERAADDAMAAFSEMEAGDANCRRKFGACEGKFNTIPARELTRGDLVEVKIDEKIPADIYIIAQTNMKVDNAALTGEAEPLDRDSKMTHEQPQETENIAFYSTFCVQGDCKAIVIRTGDETFVGSINKGTQGVKEKSTMEIEIENFIHIISAIAGVIGVTFFVVALVSGYNFIQALIFMIGIIVANVPEGLLATLTVALKLTADKMKLVQVLVKDAKTIETLGSITTIASDKTGTLTQNKMTAANAIYGNDIHSLLAVTNDQRYEDKDENFSFLVRAARLCGIAMFPEADFPEHENSEDPELRKKFVRHYNKQSKTWTKDVLFRKALGDASEQALLRFNEPLCETWYGKYGPGEGIPEDGQFVTSYREAYKKIGAIPFNSSNKWMATLHAVPEGAGYDKECYVNDKSLEKNDFLLMVKGAPERIMAVANWIRISVDKQDEAQKQLVKEQGIEGLPELVPFTEDEANKVKKAQARLAAKGERVLGFGYSILKNGQETLLKVNKDAGDRSPKDPNNNWDISDEAFIGMPPGKGGDNPDLPRGGYVFAPRGTKYNGKDHNSDFNWEVPENQLGHVFLGMISLQDPPRDEVPQAIEDCKTAGIQVVMVTGDHPATAKSISETIGILPMKTCIEDWVEAKINEGEAGIAKLQEFMWDKKVDPHTGEPIPNTGFCNNDGVTWDKVQDEKMPGHMKYSIDAEHTRLDIKDAGRNNDEVTGATDTLVIPCTEGENWKKLFHCAKKKNDETKDMERQHDVAAPEWLEAQGKTNEQWLQNNKEVDDHTLYQTRGKIYDGLSGGGWWRGFRFHDKIGLPHHPQGEEDPVKSCVVTGLQLDEFTEADWRYVLSRDNLTFARTLPAQKKTIVKHMQDHHLSMLRVGVEVQKKIVAVTGDGVNDSPALSQANCGVAMGTGSKAAKDTAHMVLTDDNFASIVDGVKEGRLIFDNLKKSIAYTLTSNIPEITPFLALICLKIPIPLETVMILCIDLGTDMLPAISLAYEESENDIMLRMPRDMDNDRMVNTRLIGLAYGIIGMIQAAAGFACYFSVFATYNIQYDDLTGTGFDWVNEDFKYVAGLDFDTRIRYLRQAQTSFLVSIIVVQWADVMICKTRSLSIFTQGMRNWILNVGLLEETLLGLVLVYVPFAHAAFKTKDMDFVMWTYGLPFSALILAFDECRKYLLRQERAANLLEQKNNTVEGRKPPQLKVGWIEGCTYY